MPRSASSFTTLIRSLSKNWASSIPTTSVSGSTFARISADVRTFDDSCFISECETMGSFEKRASISGLKTCTFCRAIRARRKRRISSSDLPENIEPAITSIHPACEVPGCSLRAGTSFSSGSILRIILAVAFINSEFIPSLDSHTTNRVRSPTVREGNLALAYARASDTIARQSKSSQSISKRENIHRLRRLHRSKNLGCESAPESQKKSRREAGWSLKPLSQSEIFFSRLLGIFVAIIYLSNPQHF